MSALKLTRSVHQAGAPGLGTETLVSGVLFTGNGIPPGDGGGGGVGVGTAGNAESIVYMAWSGSPGVGGCEQREAGSGGAGKEDLLIAVQQSGKLLMFNVEMVTERARERARGRERERARERGGSDVPFVLLPVSVLFSHACVRSLSLPVPLHYYFPPQPLSLLVSPCLSFSLLFSPGPLSLSLSLTRHHGRARTGGDESKGGRAQAASQ